MTVAALVAALSMTRFAARTNSTAPERRVGPLGRLFIALFALGSCYYMFTILDTNPTGYPLLRFLNRTFGDSSEDTSALATVFRLVLGLGLLTLFGGIPPTARDSVARLPRGHGVCGRGGVIWLYRHGLNRDVSIFSASLIIGFCVLAADLLLEHGFGLFPRLTWEPQHLPKRMMFLSVVALLGMGHAYTYRIFNCSRTLGVEGLDRIADAPEVSRAVFDGERDALLLVYRSEQRIVRLNLKNWRFQDIDPGPLADRRRETARHFDGIPEDLIYIPQKNVYVATLNPFPDLAARLPESTRGALRDLLVFIDHETANVIDVVAMPDLCWINSIRWNDERGTLYIGCEDIPRLHEFDLDAKLHCPVDGPAGRRRHPGS
ncbi:MAG: hypothetical protein M5R36_04365 [Deltaproteobacteria bacterium]|nr:hypothetical protein [Deltaproteobacteria bacterium]